MYFKYNFYFAKFLVVEEKMLAHEAFLSKLKSSFLTTKWCEAKLPQLQEAALIIDESNSKLDNFKFA